MTILIKMIMLIMMILSSHHDYAFLMTMLIKMIMLIMSSNDDHAVLMTTLINMILLIAIILILMMILSSQDSL